MKKRILKCIIFLLILLVILCILSKIMIPKNNTREAGIPKKLYLASGILAEPENTIDVLVVGDSESYTSYIPLEIWNKYGISSYVCGTPAQRLPLTWSFILQSLKTQKPKILILEADLLYRRWSLTSPFSQAVDKMLPVFEYHDRWKTLTPADFFENVDYRYIQEEKGYYYSAKVKKNKKEDYMDNVDKERNIPKSNKLGVKAIKKLCDSKGIELVMYSAPTIDWNNNKHEGVKKFAQELKVDYMDFNMMKDVIQIDWKTDSRDKGAHLNHEGAKKVTEYLGEYLNNKNILQDHRGDENYNSWNEAYNNYKEREEHP